MLQFTKTIILCISLYLTNKENNKVHYGNAIQSLWSMKSM